MIDESAVDAFWRWFVDAAPQFGDGFENAELIAELDRRVSALADGVVFEIGPGQRELHALVISPGGDPQLLLTTRAIVARAPQIPDWELHSTKPAKEWVLEFELGDPPVSIDARAWRCLVEPNGDGVDLVVEAPSISHLGDDDKRHAVRIVLDGVLGEKVRFTRVERLVIANHIGSVEPQRLVAIADLRFHVRDWEVHLDEALASFRKVLCLAWREIDVAARRTNYISLASDWAQATWEIVVELPISVQSKAHPIYLERYGEGADWGDSSRVFSPDAVSTHTVICLPREGSELHDVLNDTLFEASAGFPLDEFVAMRDGWHYREPPFDCVLIYGTDPERVVRVSDVRFELRAV